MKVLIAIDSFKGSITSKKASEAIASGIYDVYPEAEINRIPLGDGGEGTVEALIEASNGRLVKKEVQGPLTEKVIASYGISGDGKTAMIEVAEACGLPLVPTERRNPLKTTTYGVGELIVDAMEKGCRKFIIGLGGSSTNDAGVGMLQALGFQFLDEQLLEVTSGGEALKKIEHIRTDNVHPLLNKCQFQVACDVNNHLYGENGAAHVYGPQKGASQEMVEQLDEGLRHFADIVQDVLEIDIHAIEGAGAAGGLGAAFAGFLQASLESGIELVLDFTDMETYVKEADIVITGEGMLDGQTSMGKAPLGIASLAKEHGVPVIALAGGLNHENFQLNEQGMTACFSILHAPMSLDEAMEVDTTYRNLEFTTNQLFRLIEGMQLRKIR